MKKVLFIDRDGTIIKEPSGGQAGSLEILKFFPGVIGALSAIARDTDYEMVMIGNRDEPGTSAFPDEILPAAHEKMLDILRGEGVIFAELFTDRSFCNENSSYRKPGTARLARYLSQGVDLSSSFIVGDSPPDIALAQNLGCGAIYFNNDRNEDAILCTTDWNEISRFLVLMPRKARVVRKTNETDIELEVNLDGTGKASVSTGSGFLNHMIEQVARHSGIDISLNAKGDLNVDDHHLVEDTAIVTGEAFRRALGSGKGIGRYGFALPMDDSMAQVLVDLGGRPWIDWQVRYSSEKVGDVSSQMFFHFFKSFSDSARCNIHVNASGENDHHKTEAVFKAFARALGMAAARTGGSDLPSTKGVL